jgi:hypothetical protein
LISVLEPGSFDPGFFFGKQSSSFKLGMNG